MWSECQVPSRLILEQNRQQCISEKAPGFWSRLLTSDLSLPVAAAAAAELLQSCPTLCSPTDSIDGSAVPGILQAGTLEWVAISFSITSRY